MPRLQSMQDHSLGMSTQTGPTVMVRERSLQAQVDPRQAARSGSVETVRDKQALLGAVSPIDPFSEHKQGFVSDVNQTWGNPITCWWSNRWMVAQIGDRSDPARCPDGRRGVGPSGLERASDLDGPDPPHRRICLGRMGRRSSQPSPYSWKPPVASMT
jgi:hypothetical protein